jgi:hypothetical protein
LGLHASRFTAFRYTLSDLKKSSDPVSTLCPACGLCCNGALFGDVELRPNDNPERLAALGMALEPKGQKIRFLQPCSCFDGTLCGIYADRPSRCRSFECRLLQRTQAGTISTPAALKAIAAARRQVETVRRLLGELGQRDEHLPLSRRYAKVMAEPIDLAGDDRIIELRSQLMLAVHKLTKILERDFLT